MEGREGGEERGGALGGGLALRVERSVGRAEELPGTRPGGRSRAESAEERLTRKEGGRRIDRWLWIWTSVGSREVVVVCSAEGCDADGVQGPC